MATTDIGRVTPIWRGFYSAATTYELNDIVIDTAGSVWWHKSEELTTGVVPAAGEIWDAVIDMSIFSGLIQAAITTAQTALAAAQAALAEVSADADRAETAADNAENSAAAASESAAGVGALAQAAAASAEAAAGSATGAAGSAQAAAGSKSDAEAYAVGKRGGEDVGSTDPTYHNNAKYYAEQAASEAEAAAQSAEDAQDVLDSIPEDYSQLSADVGDLKTQLNVAVNNRYILSDNMTKHEIDYTNGQEIVITTTTGVAFAANNNIYTYDSNSTFLGNIQLLAGQTEKRITLNNGMHFMKCQNTPAVPYKIMIVDTSTMEYILMDSVVPKLGRLNETDLELAKGIITFDEYGQFANGGLNTDGTLKMEQPYRVSSTTHITAPYDLTISVKNGYKWGYIPFVSDTPGSWSGWYTSEITIPKNTEFVIQIAKVTEDTTSTADVNEFIDSVYFDVYLTSVIEEKTHTDADVSNNVSLHFTWYYNGTRFAKVTTTDYPISNETSILISKGTEISCDSGYRYKIYLIGFDGTVISASNEWLTSKTTISQNCYMLFSFAATNGSTVQTIDSLLPHLHIVSETNKDTALMLNEVKTLMDIAESNKYDYSYDGGALPVNKGKYRIKPTYVVPPTPGSMNVESAVSVQGFGYYNGVIVQLYGQNAAALIEYSTKSVIGKFEAETLHGNAIGFTNEFYSEGDAYPLAIISDGLSNIAFQVRVDETNGLTIIKKIVYPLNKCGYYVSTMVDAENQLLYTVGYTENSYSTDTNGTNKMIFAKWDLSNLTDNGDNTYTPEFIDSFTTNFILAIQGPCFYNGLMYVVSSHYKNTSTKIYVIDPARKAIRNIITSFPNAIKNRETEAIFFTNIDGTDCALIITAYADQYYLIEFNS